MWNNEIDGDDELEILVFHIPLCSTEILHKQLILIDIQMVINLTIILHLDKTYDIQDTCGSKWNGDNNADESCKDRNTSSNYDKDINIIVHSIVLCTGAPLHFSVFPMRVG